MSGSLGSISSGPVVNEDGEIIGVSVVEARRRGRIFTLCSVGLRRDASKGHCSETLGQWNKV